MEIAAILLTLGVIVLVGLYLYAPFLERQARHVTEDESELSALLAERDRIISALQELDFDFKLDKIPAEDYPEQRTSLLQKGADILRKIDSFSPKAGLTQDTESRIEKAVAARRADTATKRTTVSDDQIESMVAERRKSRKDITGGFCAYCGKPVMFSDKFCPSCGKVL